jgi:hypothetical protein
VVVAAMAAAPAVGRAEAGRVHFFNMNGGPRDGVHCTPPFTKCLERVGIIAADQRKTVKCKKSKACKNDDARSAMIIGPITAGWSMVVYDNTDGKKSDDWAVIQFIRDLPAGQAVTIGTFERSYTESFVRVTYHRKNGLDGKISRVEIRP